MKCSLAGAAAKSLQLCPTLCDPIDGSPSSFPVPEILQARTLEWVAISFSNAWKWKVKVKSLSHVQLLATPWTAAYQVPPPMGFSRQESWSGLPLPSPTHSLQIAYSYPFIYFRFCLFLLILNSFYICILYFCQLKMSKYFFYFCLLVYSAVFFMKQKFIILI